MNSFVLTFKNTHAAMTAEEFLKSVGYMIKMIPTPRQISSECGFSIRVRTENTAVSEELTNRLDTIERIYLQYTAGGSRKYEEIYKRNRTGLSTTGH